MKSSKSMRETAKAISLRGDIIEAGGYAGYALTIKKLREIYTKEGFPVMKKGCKTLDNHIAMWEFSHGALRVHNIVFFALDPEDPMDDEPQEGLQKYMAKHESQGIVNISEVLNREAIQ